MERTTRYFLYSIVQYVHTRREERLNLGIVVFDPERQNFHPALETKLATRRVKSVFPDVDRTGLEMYLGDLQDSLRFDTSGVDLAPGKDPFGLWLLEFQNVIQFTPGRPFPAASATAALQRLVEIYITDPQTTGFGETIGTVDRTRKLTGEVIQKVLNPVQGFAVTPFTVPLPGLGPDHMFLLKFPFLVFEEFLIDTLSFASQRTEFALAQAEKFIGKVLDLRRMDPEFQRMRPYASIAINPERESQGLALMEHVMKKTGLQPSRLARATEPDLTVMMEDILQQAQLN